MALLSAITRVFGKQHKLIHQSNLTKKQLTALVLLPVVIYAATPPFSLAFEAGLQNAPAKKLAAPVRLLHHAEFKRHADIVYQPKYTARMANAVLANPSVRTKTGHWPHSVTRLAYNSSSNPSPPQLAPLASSPVILEGEASYYSRAGCLGCNPGRIMANGQPLNDQAMTMAIGADLKHLVGYRAKVTNLNTNQSVNVLITDTGGFYQAKYGHRVADLTIAAKQAIGMRGGVGQVRVEVY